MNFLSLYRFSFLSLSLFLGSCYQNGLTSKAPEGVTITNEKKQMLTKELNKVYEEDQKCRLLVSSTISKYGLKSVQILKIAKNMNRVDSLNIIIVKSIIKKYGWLGSETVGTKGNSAIFLVIQHSEKSDRAYFLPIMRDAVRKNRANKQDLALLEDRVATDQGKKQLYGTQIGLDTKTNNYYLMPLENPGKVDERRSKMGLIPIADYLSQWQIDLKVSPLDKE
ncbi:DUF6624 domain-containing protein [Pedobacter cryoconitis]|uniref:Uncharacterized protein n=1 Tax=Pedobacter cryoconitis TaxID=188932 RepID=A0A327RRZ0_9SPHI|nr:DUF6624 domain-containing protein [Pedobacter cryoconitis]RAJ19756.1 hypothetical protein LY11_05287 [Pedobacter cryoconitis]